MAAAAGRGAGGAFGDLAPRLASGAVMAAVGFAAIVAGGAWIAALAALAAGVMMIEWRGIALGRVEVLGAGFYVLAVAGACWLAHKGAMGPALAWLATIAGMAGAVDALLGRASTWPVVGALYVGLAAIFAIGLRGDPAHGLLILAFIVTIVGAADVGAYFAGRLIGGPRLWPRVSPTKTWAGLCGAVGLSAAAGAIFALATPAGPVGALSGVAAALALVAATGDLIESAFKRGFGVKDAGRLIPGHGGLLDRMDGLIAVLIAAAMITIMRGGAPIVQW